MTTPTQAQRTITVESRLLDVVAFLGFACVVVVVVAGALALGDMWPPRSLADPMGVSGVQ